jgi:hypothetical protein
VEQIGGRVQPGFILDESRGRLRRKTVANDRLAYSHSIVAGGLELTSYTTRLIPGT